MVLKDLKSNPQFAGGEAIGEGPVAADESNPVPDRLHAQVDRNRVVGHAFSAMDLDAADNNTGAGRALGDETSGNWRGLK